MDVMLNYFLALFTIPNLIGAVIGTSVGIILGALPGCTPSLGLAIFIPITFTMDPTTALIYLGSIYAGGMYGGTITAILINVPGTAAAAAATIEGYKMTQHGRAAEALTEAACSSFFGNLFGTLVLLFMAPPLARLTFKFGPQENFMLALFGLTVISSLSTKNILKGIITGLFGLLLACVGMDPMLGRSRLTFGVRMLIGGMPLVPVVIGLFAFAMVIGTLSTYKKKAVADAVDKIKVELSVSLKNFFHYPASYIRSAIIGTIVGIIPGTGGEVASYVSLNQGYMWRGKQMTDYDKETGWREGVACVQAADSAVTGGTIIPTLTLGVPGNATTAILMSGLMIHGLTPGYELFTKHASITYPFILSLFVAAVLCTALGLWCSPYIARITRCPANILSACIMGLCVVGAFCIRNMFIDLWIMFAFGLIGYFMKQAKFEVAPVLLGMILGKLAEIGLSQSLVLEKTVPKVFLSMLGRPVCLILLAFMVISVVYPIWSQKHAAKQAKA